MRTSICKCLLLTLFFPLASYASGSIVDIATLNNLPFSIATGVSANGSVVSGYAIIPPETSHFRAIVSQNTNLINLGTLNGGINSFTAKTGSLSGDGLVVVGTAKDGGVPGMPERAFRWSQSSGLISLGTLGGFNSRSNSTNYDGSIVVGASEIVGGELRAFRWTQTDGMVDLETLGSVSSEAFGINSDGSVVVGRCEDILGDIRAFRWTEATGMECLDTLPFGDFSEANGVSGDGNIIVGTSTNDNSELRAFRWTDETGMEDLGILAGGTFSRALGISQNGLVIVGTADAADLLAQGSRWTESTGLQTVEDWLRTAGVVVPEDITAEARASNADGSVVVGSLRTNEAYIARVLAPPGLNILSRNGAELARLSAFGGSGLITINELFRSIASTRNLLNFVLQTNQVILNGIHAHPLSKRISDGNYGIWIAGNWGYFNNKFKNSDKINHNAREHLKGSAATAEVGLAYLFPYDIQLGLGIGRTLSHQGLNHKVKGDLQAIYVVGEMLAALSQKIWVSLTGILSFGDIEIHRYYINAGVLDKSKGTPDTKSRALRARLDWEDSLNINDLSFTPYVQIATWRGYIKPYAEITGGFPISFNYRKGQATEGRIGIDTAYPYKMITLLGSLAAVQCFSRYHRSRGQVIGLMNFNLQTVKNRSHWLHAALGLECPISPGKFIFYVNGATRGQDPKFWANITYILEF